jgi:protoporphyrinogen oxidase
MNIAVVGGGLAGLAVALGCEQDGHHVTLFESSSTLGGRMKTVQADNHSLDVGFHVLHTAYPALKRWVDLNALHAAPMDACTMTVQPSTGRRRLLGDALRRPRYLFPTLKSVGLFDGLRFLRWRLRTSARDPERGMDLPTPTIAKGLEQRNFNASTQRVLRPLFAGITLDPTLSERLAFADFTWSAMSHGSMVMPRDGIAAVPQQLAARLRTTELRLNTSVQAVSKDSVVVEGQSETFDRVVLAVPQHVAGAMLPSSLGNHRPVERLTTTVVFTAQTAPFTQARLLLNEEWGEEGQHVLHVHLPTNLHPHPEGHHWVVATLVGEDAENVDVESVRGELTNWFGPSVAQWSHLTTTTVRHALPHINPSHHARTLPNLEVNGVLLAGDHRTHPSVQGTLRSAERVLEHLNIPFPRRP